MICTFVSYLTSFFPSGSRGRARVVGAILAQDGGGAQLAKNPRPPSLDFDLCAATCHSKYLVLILEYTCSNSSLLILEYTCFNLLLLILEYTRFDFHCVCRVHLPQSLVAEIT